MRGAPTLVGALNASRAIGSALLVFPQSREANVTEFSPDVPARDVMDRRRFLVNGAAAGAVLGAGGLATGVGSARAAGPKKFGPAYTIGQTCGDFPAPAQYARPAHLR